MKNLQFFPMNQQVISRSIGAYKPRNRIRFVTAAALFDGHDASINIMRRILQASGAEVIHLGHNRSVNEIVTAAIQEDVQGIALTSYQGGHVEYLKYTIDLLRQNSRSDIRVFAGGGGVIVAEEVDDLHAYGVTKVYTPQDGSALGLQGMINDVLAKSDVSTTTDGPKSQQGILEALKSGDRKALARVISVLEEGICEDDVLPVLAAEASKCSTPIIGITGTGGAGKSTLTDELVRRFRLDYEDALNIGIISIDPSRKRTGGALLGDRIRMNAIDTPKVFMRSLATRDTGSELSSALPHVIAACKVAKFDLLIVETSGIGQGDAAIVDHVDISIYVMTPEFGAASQLEKIDMLDFADLIAINKFDRKGAEDALRDVSKQYQRNRNRFAERPDQMPVFGTMASRFNDDGVTAVYQDLCQQLRKFKLPAGGKALPRVDVRQSSNRTTIIPRDRERYLAEVASTIRDYHREVVAESKTAHERQALRTAKQMLQSVGANTSELDQLYARKDEELSVSSKKQLSLWPVTLDLYSREDYVVNIRDREMRTTLTSNSLSGSKIRKVALPHYRDEGEILRFLMKENLPGSFPYTAGVFAFKRDNEDPTRMFAGEGDPFRTNRRFKRLSEGQSAKRLSTAFDSVTLYGCDPDLRPDIYGKIGNSGVSIATVDDMQALYDGFDLCDPATSVSMTINGPAPIILAFYFHTAIEQQLKKFAEQNHREPTETEVQKIREWCLSTVRGTVQADILKEDQGQNTCIFSTEFALKMMGDIQEYFVHHNVRNFYSVSISGYHIAEAGANPISQLAFTLANGFTFVEAYLARGMHIDDFAPNLSFFFSNGMDPEYSVLGRVARRIWAVAMKNKYGGNERSQKLKYHIQTSGRSLHAQEMDFNDIRTTLQALCAIYDNCNSLHTNAFDEAVTTPTDDSVRRAMAIQLIINREWGLAKNENPQQGSFIIDELTDLVEEAVLREFEAISARGGVLGAMETGYQRGRIQEQSMYYEQRKHDGSYPIIGVNTFLNDEGEVIGPRIELARSSEAEKQSQLSRLHAFHEKNASEAPRCLAELKKVAMANENVFATLMEAVKHCSLGQISETIYEVGGRYRRNM